jgi:hypothetical protein
VPANLDWELWQGPAPRGAYRDNVQPYNWRWLRNYGTGETLNSTRRTAGSRAMRKR